MNPYSLLLDRCDDQAEHARELAAGMAIPAHGRLPRTAHERQAHTIEALDRHRALRRELQAQLAQETDAA